LFELLQLLAPRLTATTLWSTHPPNHGASDLELNASRDARNYRQSETRTVGEERSGDPNVRQLEPDGGLAAGRGLGQTRCLNGAIVRLLRLAPLIDFVVVPVNEAEVAVNSAEHGSRRVAEPICREQSNDDV
jgi:hypothetical protein